MASLLEFDLDNTIANEGEGTFCINSSEGSIGFGIDDDGKGDITLEFRGKINVVSANSNVSIRGKTVKMSNDVKVQDKEPALVGAEFKDKNNMGCMHTCVHVFSPNMTGIPPVTYLTCWLEDKGKLQDDGATTDIEIKDKHVGIVGTTGKYEKHNPNDWTDFYNNMKDPLLRATHSEASYTLITPNRETVSKAVTSIGASTTVSFDGKPVALKANQNVVLSDSGMTVLIIT